MIKEQYRWEVKDEVLNEIFHHEILSLSIPTVNDLYTTNAQSREVFQLPPRESEPWAVIDPHKHLPIF